MPQNIGAGEGNRTPTWLPIPDFESGASTSSATPASIGKRTASISNVSLGENCFPVMLVKTTYREWEMAREDRKSVVVCTQ